MKILGSIDADGELRITSSIMGFRGVAKVNGIVDTGFAGAISLAVTIIAKLGMDLNGIRMYRLADGSTTRSLVFNGKVDWMGKVSPIEIVLSFSDETLIGVDLLKNCKLTVDFPKRQFFIEE